MYLAFSLLILVLVTGLPLAMFGLAALRWGVDSRDAPDSPEWLRRQTWRGLGH